MKNNKRNSNVIRTYDEGKKVPLTNNLIGIFKI